MTIKEKVAARLPLAGTHVHLTDPIVTEIMASSGYDYLWVDMEHTALSCEQVYHHILAAHSCGTPVFVRVPVDDLTVTKRILEMNVDGVIFPMIKDAAHAKRLLDNTLYPPYGTRGCGPKGAIRYGLDPEMEYYRSGHLNLCRFVQIEQASAVAEVEQIAALPYLDGCVLGVHDLSGSIGRLGDVFCPENLQLAQRAVDAFRELGKTVGISTYATSAEALARFHNMGVNMITTGADYEYIRDRARDTLATLRGVRGE